jgi:signal transduction histidine kinase
VRPSIRLRLTAWYAGIFLASGVLLLAVSYGVVRHEFGTQSEKVHVRVDEVTALGRDGKPRRLQVRIQPGIPAETASPVRRLDAAEQAAYRHALASYRAAAARADHHALRRVLLLFAVALAAVTVGSIVAGWVVAGRALRPIARITATARSISDRTLHERIGLGGPRDELRELADVFDTMLGRLEGAFESQRRFVANASHELRTPLAIVRTELDVTLSDPDARERDLRQMAAVVRETNERMERLIASLLALAKGEGGVSDPRPADLAAAVRPALRAHGFHVAGEPPAETGAGSGEVPLQPGGALRLDARLDPAPVSGDAVLLERLAGNLVENAVRYNAALGWVRVQTGVEAGRAVLRVVNPGELVDPAEAAQLTEPFRRLETSRSRTTGGYGLGLAVVRAVARSHGGDVHVRACGEGGLDITVALPAAGPAPAHAVPAPFATV